MQKLLVFGEENEMKQIIICNVSEYISIYAHTGLASTHFLDKYILQ